MAVTAREVLMVFRGQNYLSSSIRRVGRDVGSLSRGQQLGLQRQQMQITAQRLRQSRALDLAERASITRGVRRQALTKAMTANERALAAAQANVAQARLRQAANETALMERRVRESRLNRLASAGRALSGHTLEETNRLAQAASRRVQELAEMQSILAKRTDIATRSLSANALEKQILIEKDAQLAQREAFLTQRINNTSRALLRNRDIQAENALRQQMLPIERWRDFARTVEHVGTVLTRVGGIAVLAVGLASHAAATFQTQSTLAATQARPVAASSAVVPGIASRVSAKVLEQMREFPATAQEMNDAFYQVFSGTNVQNVGKASDMIRVFNMAAVAGAASLEEMTQAGISIFNNFPGEFKNSTDAMNVFAAAVRYGRMTYSQFATTLGYIAPIAKDVGLSFRNAAEDMAFFTRQTGGTMTRQDAQGLARLYQLFARTDVTRGLQLRGIDVFDKLTGKMRPIVEIMQEIRKEMKLTPQETINFFKNISARGSGKQGTQGTIQAIRIFSQGLNNAQAYLDVTQKVRQDNDEMIKSFEAMNKTPGVQWAVFINQIKVLVYQLGTQAIPVLIEMGRPLGRLVDWFNKLSPHTKHLIATFTTIAAVGTLATGVVLTIVGAFASLAGSILLLARFRGELALLSGETGAIGIKLALGFGLVGAIGLLIMFHKQVDIAVDKLGGMNVVLALVNTTIAALTFRRAIAGIIALTTAEEAAMTMAVRLRLALLALTAIGAITITIYELHKILKNKLPGFNEPVAPGEAFQIGPQTLANTIRRDSQSKAAVARVRQDVRKYSPQYQRIFKEAEVLFAKGFDADKVAATLHQKFRRVSQLAIPQIVADAGTLVRSIKRDTGAPQTGAEQQTAGNLAQERAKYNAKQLQDANSFITRMKAARAIMLANPTDLVAARNYERLQSQLNKRFEKQPALLGAINDVLNTYDKDLKKADKSTKTLGVTTQDMLSRVQSMYDGFLEQEQTAFGQLFSGPAINGPLMQNRLQWGGRLSGGDLVTDLKSQIRQFRTFHNQIDALKSRGAPDELIKQLEQLGPAALDQIKALNSLPPGALRGYFNLFRTAQQEIHKRTMQDLRNQLHQYNRYGKNIGMQIAAGLRSEQPALTKALTSMIHNMFPNLPTGKTGAGGHATHKPQTSTTPTSKTEHHTHYHLTAPKKDHLTLKAQARHVDLTRRNKFARGGITK